MAMAVHYFSSYGMEPFNIPTDPGQDTLVNLVKAKFAGIETHQSPYRDYEVNTIAAAIEQLPAEDIVFVAGASLGACNCTVVASRTKHKIHGVFGYQASVWGDHTPMPANALFAVLFTSDVPIPAPGIGNYVWSTAPDFDPHRLHVIPRNILHPGDYDQWSQQIQLTYMARIIARPGD
jgi:hypothetical protein